MPIWNKVKMYRSAKNLSQEDLAEFVGCSRNTIGSIEKNAYNPSLELALWIAEVLEQPITELFGLVEEEEEDV